MISPLRILMLYRQEGLVQTQALYSMEAPWLPKSESGTRSPSLHLRHRGKAFSTKSPPSFSLEDYLFVSLACSKAERRSKPRGSLRRCIRIPTAGHKSMPLLSYHKLRLVSVFWWKIFHRFYDILALTIAQFGLENLRFSKLDWSLAISSHANCLHISATSAPSIAGVTNSVKRVVRLV